MLDIGLFELLVVGGVGLVVIGPERLPGAIKTGALWFGRVKRGLLETRREIEQSIGADEIRQELRNEEIMASLEKLREARTQLEEDINAHVSGDTIEHSSGTSIEHHDDNHDYHNSHDHDNAYDHDTNHDYQADDNHHDYHHDHSDNNHNDHNNNNYDVNSHHDAGDNHDDTHHTIHNNNHDKEDTPVDSRNKNGDPLNNAPHKNTQAPAHPSPTQTSTKEADTPPAKS